MTECLTHLMPMSSSVATVSTAQRKRRRVIWATRLEHAWRMLTSSSHVGLPVSEIALHSGSLDQATSSRMFKRRYGLIPREARESARERRWSMSANGALKLGARSGFLRAKPGRCGRKLNILNIV